MERKTHAIILVDLYWTRDKDPRVPLGHASILTHLKSSGIDALSVVFAKNGTNTSPDRVVDAMLRAATGADAPVDVAIGAYVWAEELVQQVILRLRKRGFEGRIILGGPQISYAAAGSLESMYPGVDLFIRGYGEDALYRLAMGEWPGSIVGVHVAGTKDVGAQTSVDLQTLPSPFLEGIVQVAEQKFIRWETQRGCLYNCSFCQHKEAGAKLPHTDFSWDRLAAEIDLFCEAKVEQVAVLDPIFNMGAQHERVLERFVANGFEGELSLQCRPEQITDKFLELVSRQNVKLEFGIQTIHRDENRAVRRFNRMDKVEATLRAVSGRNIPHEVSLIFGLPHQTLGSFLESVAWCLKMGVPTIKAFPLVLLRGTKLSENRAKWGYQVSNDDMPLACASNSFSYEDWRDMARVSEALSLTKGGHPTLLELLTMSQTLEPELPRFTPSKAG